MFPHFHSLHWSCRFLQITYKTCKISWDKQAFTLTFTPTGNSESGISLVSMSLKCKRKLEKNAESGPRCCEATTFLQISVYCRANFYSFKKKAATQTSAAFHRLHCEEIKPEVRLSLSFQVSCVSGWSVCWWLWYHVCFFNTQLIHGALRPRHVQVCYSSSSHRSIESDELWVGFVGFVHFSCLWLHESLGRGFTTHNSCCNLFLQGRKSLLSKHLLSEKYTPLPSRSHQLHEFLLETVPGFHELIMCRTSLFSVCIVWLLNPCNRW